MYRRSAAALVLACCTPATALRVASSRLSQIRMAAPSRKIDKFQTVSIECSKCSCLLFRYKKKNGLKSNLVKAYVERIVSDPADLLSARDSSGDSPTIWECPSCGSNFARHALIHGRPALKMIGGKVRMTK